MNESQRVILEFLTGYRRTRLRQELGAGLLVMASVLACVILGAALIALAKSAHSYLRILLLAFGGFGVVFVVYKYILAPRRLLRPRGVSLAREVEQRLGEQDLRLVSALELMDRADKGSSDVLVDAHIVQVAESLKEFNPQSLRVHGRFKTPSIIASMAIGVTVCFGLFWPGTLSNGLKQLIHGVVMEQGDESLEEASWVGDMALQYFYPAYTQLPDRKVEGSDGAILAIPGTRVQLSARADRRISKAALKFGDETVPLKVSDGYELTAELVLMNPGSYRFELLDDDGRESKSKRTYPIQIQADRTPSVRLLKPKIDMVVRERDVVELAYDARDDFGLEEIRLVWTIPSRAKGAVRKTLRRLGGKKSARSTYSWNLAPLSLAPGEQVQFYVEALDNDTVLGPKTGRSATVTLKVFSAIDNHRDLMKEVQRVWEYMLGLLAGHLDMEPEAKPASENLEDHRKLAQGLDKLIEQIGDSLSVLHKDEMAWKPLVLALQNMKRRLTDASYQTQWTMRAVGLDRKASKRELRSLSRLRTWRISILEKDLLYLEDLLDMDRLNDLQHLAEQLARDQKRLADLMEKYKKAPDEETRRAIMDEIARIKQRIAKLLARQREVLSSVRDEYFNPDALKKLMSDRLSMSSLDRIQKLLMEGKVDQAMAELEKLRKQIANLQKAIDKSQQGYGKERYKELAKAMTRIQGELSQIIQQQKKLMDSTEVIRQKLMDRLSKKGTKLQEEIIKKVLARLAQLQKHVHGIGPSGLESFVLKQRQEVLSRAEGLKKLLDTKALGQALDTASELFRATSRLKQFLSFFGFSDRPVSNETLQQWKDLSGQASDDAQYVYRELRKLIPPASSMLSSSERKQVSGLRRQQKQLQQRLDKLQDQMGQVNKKAPLFGQPMLDGMQRSGGFMQGAAEKLRHGDPRSAWPHERDALGELEQIQQQMKKSCKRGGQGQGMPLPMGRSGGGGYDSGGPGDMSTEPVEIPGEDEFQAPEKYRKELIDGMKDPVPEEYQPQVQRYYEELVK